LADLGITSDDVMMVTTLLHYRNGFPIAIAGSIIPGVSFCQFHRTVACTSRSYDFGVREPEFIRRSIGDAGARGGEQPAATA
jgi:hypothetical protein